MVKIYPAIKVFKIVKIGEKFRPGLTAMLDMKIEGILEKMFYFETLDIFTNYEIVRNRMQKLK